MPKVLGYVWSVRWGNPFTQPPNGLPRELLRVETRPGSASNDCPPEIDAKHREMGLGKGWSVWCGAIEKPVKRLPPERLAKIRIQHLEKRMRKRHGLFAEQYMAEAIAAKPEYYAGHDYRQKVQA